MNAESERVPTIYFPKKRLKIKTYFDEIIKKSFCKNKCIKVRKLTCNGCSFNITFLLMSSIVSVDNLTLTIAHR